MRNLKLHCGIYLCLLISLCLPVSNLFAAAASFESDDERFKAAFIYNFAKFTHWPESSFNQNQPLVLCTVGIKKLDYNLNRLSGKIIQGRQLSIKALTNDKYIEDCHMLYISKSAKNRLTNLLKLTRNKPILTVSDISSFSKQGGIIQFNRKSGQTHLTINLDVAQKSNLKISSRLLILAKVISKNVNP